MLTISQQILCKHRIVPEWYFLPFYAILRSIPDKLGGVVMCSVLIILLLTIHNTSEVVVQHSGLFLKFLLAIG